MMPMAAVADTGNKLRHPHFVETQSFAQMKGLSACQKSRLGSHVNSTATVRSLLKFDPFYSYLCLLDSCQAPGDFKDLRETTGLGRNVNGSVCLNFVCQCVFWTPNYTDVTHSSQICERFRWFSM
jgi:hypothetical protein